MFLKFAKRVVTEAFHFIIPILTSGNGENQDVIVRRTRDENPSTYTYCLSDEGSDSPRLTEAMWSMFYMRNNMLFTTDDLRKAKKQQQLQQQADLFKTYQRQLFIGIRESCLTYMQKLGEHGDTT